MNDMNNHNLALYSNESSMPPLSSSIVSLGTTLINNKATVAMIPGQLYLNEYPCP